MAEIHLPVYRPRGEAGAEADPRVHDADLRATGVGEVLRADGGVGKRVRVDEDVVDDLADAVAQDVGRFPVVDSKSVDDVRGGELDLSAHANLTDRNESPGRLVAANPLSHSETNRLEEVHALEEFVAAWQGDLVASLAPALVVIQVRREDREREGFDPSQRAHLQEDLVVRPLIGRRKAGEQGYRAAKAERCGRPHGRHGFLAVRRLSADPDLPAGTAAFR